MKNVSTVTRIKQSHLEMMCKKAVYTHGNDQSLFFVLQALCMKVKTA